MVGGTGPPEGRTPIGLGGGGRDRGGGGGGGGAALEMPLEGGAGLGGAGFVDAVADDGELGILGGLGGGGTDVGSCGVSDLPVFSSNDPERCLLFGGLGSDISVSSSSGSSRFGDDLDGDVRTNIASPSSTESKESCGGDPGGVRGLPTSDPIPPCCIDGACDK